MLTRTVSFQTHSPRVTIRFTENIRRIICQKEKVFNNLNSIYIYSVIAAMKEDNATVVAACNGLLTYKFVILLVVHSGISQVIRGLW